MLDEGALAMALKEGWLAGGGARCLRAGASGSWQPALEKVKGDPFECAR